MLGMKGMTGYGARASVRVQRRICEGLRLLGCLWGFSLKRIDVGGCKASLEPRKPCILFLFLGFPLLVSLITYFLKIP